MKLNTKHIPKIISLFLSLIFTAMPFYGEVTADCDTTVWYVNVYPGSEIYELEGHAALRIKSCEMDVAVNYGLFSFSEPNFVYRFVKGETDYKVGALPWQMFEREYIDNGRRMVAHKLNLSSSQKALLIDMLQENIKPENCVYRYNYVLDNCATRPLRMVELALNDTIILPEPTGIPKIDTFRGMMRYYHKNYPWYQFGIDIALGSGIDRPITVREKSFAPVVLDSQLDDAKIGEGANNPFVLETEILNDTAPEEVVETATPWWLNPLFIMWLLSLSVAVYAIYSVFKKEKFPRLVASVVFAIFGLAGLLVAFLVFISVHEATSPNYNLLWLNPLCFVPVVALWIKKAKIVNKLYFLLNFVFLMCLLIVWICGVQSPNPAFIPLVLADMTLSGLYIYQFCIKWKKTH